MRDGLQSILYLVQTSLGREDGRLQARLAVLHAPAMDGVLWNHISETCWRALDRFKGSEGGLQRAATTNGSGCEAGACNWRRMLVRALGKSFIRVGVGENKRQARHFLDAAEPQHHKSRLSPLHPCGIVPSRSLSSQGVSVQHGGYSNKAAGCTSSSRARLD
jgi:hypothetical protein